MLLKTKKFLKTLSVKTYKRFISLAVYVKAIRRKISALKAMQAE
ncbi:hypothetical protein TPE_0245 [Treponema pedis str. T A4]|uniref:Uncharacterized protein n=1 Tax=Treponema pedis str. T A4 TaxID=1291379 RepID=S6A2J9_9SPIR|nr:hypothetical protein TPE_0245 [Treponema pedis str. T A4]